MKSVVKSEDMNQFLNESKTLNMLNHPNIVKIFGLSLDSEKLPSILLEFCESTLKSKVKEGSLTKAEASFYIYQIVEGMKYVHAKGIIHRDLKPTNILVSSNGTNIICDFGISTLMTTKEQTMTFGSPKFMAPEIVDEIVDVYSFGVLIFYILSKGELPKIKPSDKLKEKKAPIPPEFSDFSRDLINECWNYDSKDHPSFSDILLKLEKGEYKLFELNSSEVDEVKNMVKLHKEIIPNY